MQKRRGSDPADVLSVQDTCCWPKCSAPTPQLALPLCEHHVMRVVRHAQDLLKSKPKDPVRVARLRQDRDGVVYFLRFQGLIKIGFTSNLKLRLSTITHDELLHAQPGTPADERRVHVAFAHLRENREWFRPEPDLMEFIEHLRHAGEVEDLAEAQ